MSYVLSKSIESPTIQFYGELQRAYDFFNGRLFDGKLSQCLMTLRSSSRHYGYHHRDRFVNTQGKTIHELGLNPAYFTVRSVQEVLSTLVHEMVHHWQEQCGNPSKSNPHNREWAVKMRDLGLQPSSTGLPDGKDTGQNVSHYIVPGGLFITACNQLLDAGFALPWVDRHAPREPEQARENRMQILQSAGLAVELSPAPVEVLKEVPQATSRIVPPQPKKEIDRMKYVCPGCGIKAWGAGGLNLACGVCEVELVGQELI